MVPIFKLERNFGNKYYVTVNVSAELLSFPDGQLQSFVITRVVVQSDNFVIIAHRCQSDPFCCTAPIDFTPWLICYWYRAQSKNEQDKWVHLGLFEVQYFAHSNFGVGLQNCLTHCTSQQPTCMTTSCTRVGVKLQRRAIENVWGFCHAHGSCLGQLQNSFGWHWLQHFSLSYQHKWSYKPLLSHCRGTILILDFYIDSFQ